MRFILFAVLLTIFTTVSAQKIGFNLGFNSNNVTRITTTFGGNKYEIVTDSERGIRTGLVGEYEHKSGITGGINVLISQKEYSYYNTLNQTVQEKINYLELPVYVGYTYTISESTKIFYDYFPIKAFLILGPNFGIALAGDQTIGTYDPKDIVFEDREPDPGEIIYSPSNTQFLFSGGASVGGIRLTLGYEIGLSDIYSSSYVEVNSKNFFVSIGYVYEIKKSKGKKR